MICPVCGNPNAGRRHGGPYFDDEFYCGECKKSYTEDKWYELRSIMIKEATEMWAENKKKEKRK